MNATACTFRSTTPASPPRSCATGCTGLSRRRRRPEARVAFIRTLRPLVEKTRGMFEEARVLAMIRGQLVFGNLHRGDRAAGLALLERGHGRARNASSPPVAPRSGTVRGCPASRKPGCCFASLMRVGLSCAAGPPASRARGVEEHPFDGFATAIDSPQAGASYAGRGRDDHRQPARAGPAGSTLEASRRCARIVRTEPGTSITACALPEPASVRRCTRSTRGCGRPTTRSTPPDRPRSRRRRLHEFRERTDDSCWPAKRLAASEPTATP